MLTYRNLAELKAGEHLLYTAGQGDYEVRAEVTVVETGSQSATVRIAKILAKGNLVKIKTGDQVHASPQELEYDD